jgi:hypothetical protein
MVFRSRHRRCVMGSNGSFFAGTSHAGMPRFADSSRDHADAIARTDPAALVIGGAVLMSCWGSSMPPGTAHGPESARVPAGRNTNYPPRCRRRRRHSGWTARRPGRRGTHPRGHGHAVAARPRCWPQRRSRLRPSNAATPSSLDRVPGRRQPQPHSRSGSPVRGPDSTRLAQTEGWRRTLRRALNAVRWEVASLAQRVGAAAKGAIMVIELAVPDDWTPGQALAMRQLLQQVIRTAQPIITAVRKDVTADQLKDVHDRIESLIREAGLQAA